MLEKERLLIQYELCPYKKRKRDMHTLEGECHVADDRGRDWNGAASSQGTTRIDGHHQKLEEARKDSVYSQRVQCPANILISDS